jgi:uncharacterized protein
MFIGLMTFELAFPGAVSIKEKRGVIKSLKDRLHREHQVCVAEVAYLDMLHVAGMAVCLVNREQNFIRSTLDRIEDKLRDEPECRLLSVCKEITPASALPTAFKTEDGEDLWREDDRREQTA